MTFRVEEWQLLHLMIPTVPIIISTHWTWHIAMPPLKVAKGIGLYIRKSIKEEQASYINQLCAFLHHMAIIFTHQRITGRVPEYCRQGRICWARFSRILRVPQRKLHKAEAASVWPSGSFPVCGDLGRTNY